MEVSVDVNAVGCTTSMTVNDVCSELCTSVLSAEYMLISIYIPEQWHPEGDHVALVIRGRSQASGSQRSRGTDFWSIVEVVP